MPFVCYSITDAYVGTKRSAPEAEPKETRASKNAKTGDGVKLSKNSKGTSKGGKKGVKASISSFELT